MRVCLYDSACTVDIFPPPLISTRESWGQSEPRLMRGGKSGRDEAGVRQVTRSMLHCCYNIILPSYHAVTLKGHHPHGAHVDAGRVTHLACVRVQESGRCESSSPCARMSPSPILVWHYLPLHVSFSRGGGGPNVTACYPHQRQSVH